MTVEPSNLVVCLQSSNACPAIGTTLIEPFLVSCRIALPFSKSTSAILNEEFRPVAFLSKLLRQRSHKDKDLNSLDKPVISDPFHHRQET